MDKPRGKKRSLAAKNVARQMLANVGKGKRPVMRKILKDNGYPPSMQKNPQKVTETLSYQEEIDPFVRKCLIQRDRFIEMIGTFDKKKDKVNLALALEAINNLTRQVQLIQGKPTENKKLTLIDLLSKAENE